MRPSMVVPSESKVISTWFDCSGFTSTLVTLVSEPWKLAGAATAVTAVTGSEVARRAAVIAPPTARRTLAYSSSFLLLLAPM